MKHLETEGRRATGAEQAVLARWGSWGAVPRVFEEGGRWPSERAELRELLSEEEYLAARRTVLNAHYTDPAYVREIWSAVQGLGFEGGRVLEPGCGAGTFLGMAPVAVDAVGVELDPVTAAIAQQLNQAATIRAESFAASRLPVDSFDLVIGNVPFEDAKLHDPRFNLGQRHSIHNHFIIKSLHHTRPGGLVAVLTSRWTMDDGREEPHGPARDELPG